MVVLPLLLRTVVDVLIYILRDIDERAASGVSVIGVDSIFNAFSGYTLSMPNSILGGWPWLPAFSASV